MIFINEIVLICSVTFMLAKGYYSEKPLIRASCEENGLMAKLIFKKPFSGTVFAQGYYSDAFCSSPNLPDVTTKELLLYLPLFSCGTQLQRRRNKSPAIKSTIQIQYHPMMKTIYDTVENVSCGYLWPVSREMWNLNRKSDTTKIPIIPYRSWLNFKLGNDVMGESEAKKKGVSYKLFLVAYIQDGGMNKDVKVGKCFAHDEHILTANTTVVEMNPVDNCSDSGSLSEFTVRPYLPVSNLMTYAEVKEFNISTKGQLFITCGMQLCEEACFRGCPEDYRHEINHWSTVSTHRLSKRAANDLSSAKVRNLENRNVFLRSTVKALSERLLEFKAQLNSQKNASNFDRRVSKSLNSERSSTQLSDGNQDYDTTSFTSTEESPLTDQSDITLTEKAIEKEVTVINHTLNSSIFATDFEEPLTVKVDDQLSKTVALQNTTIFLPAPYADYFMTTGLPIYNGSTESYEPSTGHIITSDDALRRNESSGNVLVDLKVINSTEKELPINHGVMPDCVPHFKFLVVTISLGILSFSFFLMCIGLWLYIRKEKKRTALNSYLLYSFN